MAKGQGQGVVLGFLKYVLGFDSLAFQEGLGDTQKRLKAAQRDFQRQADKFKSIGTAMTLGITAPFVGLMAKSIPAARESMEAIGQVKASLDSMGDAAERTLPQLEAQAKALMKLSTLDDDEILRKVTANLLTFGKVSGEVFDRAQLAIVNYSAKTGADLQSATIMIAKALQDPVKGVTALQKVGVKLDETQKAQIASMVKLGDTAGAQGVILKELERQYNGSAAALRAATPGIDAQQAWDNFQETLGAIAIQVLPPFTALLTKVLDGFNNLSPTTQKVAVGVAAIAAAVGPLVFGFGSLMSILSPVLARMTVAAGAGGIPALTNVLGPLGIAAAGVVIAWKNWDKIGPWIDGVATRTQKASLDIQGYFKSVNDWADNADKKLGTPTRAELFESIGAWLKKTWETANSYDLARWASNVDQAIASMVTNGIAAIQRLYNGVKNWLGDKLGAIWNGAKNGIQAVADKFKWLDDVVVGHSYIPDMVDAIGFHMARLDGNMVKVAQSAADKTATIFRKLEPEVAAIMDRLFPERVATRTYADELAKLRSSNSPDRDEAIRRLNNEKGDWFAGVQFGDPSAVVGDLESQWSKAEAANDNLAQSFERTVNDISGSLQSLSSAIKSGDWLDILSTAVDAGLSIYNAFSGGGGGGFGGFRAAGGPVSAGRSYMVGERGPEMFTASRSGYIHPSGRSGAAQKPTIVQLVVGPGQLFEPKVAGIAGNVSVEVVGASARANRRSGRQRLG